MNEWIKKKIKRELSVLKGQIKFLFEALKAKIKRERSVRGGQIKFLLSYLIMCLLGIFIGIHLLEFKSISVTSNFSLWIFGGLIQVFGTVIAITLAVLGILSEYYPQQHTYNYLFHPYFLFLSGIMILSILFYTVLRITGQPANGIEAFIIISLLAIFFVVPYSIAMAQELQSERLISKVTYNWGKATGDLCHGIINHNPNKKQTAKQLFSYSVSNLTAGIENGAIQPNEVRTLMDEIREDLEENIDYIFSTETANSTEIEQFTTQIMEDGYLMLIDWAINEERQFIASIINLAFLKLVENIISNSHNEIDDKIVDSIATQMLSVIADRIIRMENIGMRLQYTYEFESVIEILEQRGTIRYKPHLNRIRETMKSKAEK